MNITTSINNQKSVVIRGLTYKVGSYISFHKELFYIFINGMGIVQEIKPIKRYKDVHILGIDIPYEIVEVNTVHLANCSVKIPVISFIISRLAFKNKPISNILQISGVDFISLNSKPVYIKETKQILNKLKGVRNGKS